VASVKAGKESRGTREGSEKEMERMAKGERQEIIYEVQTQACLRDGKKNGGVLRRSRTEDHEDH